MAELPCIKTLIIESSEGLAQNLISLLQQQLPVGECDYSPSLFKGVKSLLEEAYDLCFISSAFPLPELEVFFRDAKGSIESKGCVFAMVQEKMDPDFDRASLTDFGFQTVVTRKLSFDDVAAIKANLGEKLHACEIKRRVIDVDRAIELAFKELDQMAADLRRGRKIEINTLSMDFINLQTEFDKEILENYFEKLINKSISAEAPLLSTQIEIPDSILSRNLPKLSKNTYTGASRRVWKVLVDMHAEDKSEAPKETTETTTNPFAKNKDSD